MSLPILCLDFAAYPLPATARTTIEPVAGVPVLTRRRFFGGLLAAPAIIRPGLLMPVKPLLSVVVTRTYFELPLGADWQAKWLGKAIEIRFSDEPEAEGTTGGAP